MQDLISKKLAAVVVAGVGGVATGNLSGWQLVTLLGVYCVCQAVVDCVQSVKGGKPAPALPVP